MVYYQNADSTTVHMETTTTPIKIIVIALVTAELLMRRSNISVSRFPFREEIIVKSKTPNVVVFIPPAVEPGDPPINIRIMVTKIVVSFIPTRLMVLNPAVLGVTD
jgi:hypothetical protein